MCMFAIETSLDLIRNMNTLHRVLSMRFRISSGGSVNVASQSDHFRKVPPADIPQAHVTSKKQGIARH